MKTVQKTFRSIEEAARYAAKIAKRKKREWKERNNVKVKKASSLNTP